MSLIFRCADTMDEYTSKTALRLPESRSNMGERMAAQHGEDRMAIHRFEEGPVICSPLRGEQSACRFVIETARSSRIAAEGMMAWRMRCG
jgi:hypothetical protein